MKSLRKIGLIGVIGTCMFAMCLSPLARTGLASLASTTVLADETDEPRPCSNLTLKGSYGSGTTGLINSSGNPSDITIPSFVPFAEAAWFAFDGNGNVNVQSQPIFGGQIIPLGTAVGTYIVDSLKCTGTMTFTTSTGEVLHRSLVIVQNGREIEFVSTDPGFVIAGSMKRQ